MNLEEMGVQEMNIREISNINGGYGWLRELIKGAISGELINGVKNAYNDALSGYIEACGNGTYDGIPGCRR